MKLDIKSILILILLGHFYLVLSGSSQVIKHQKKELNN